MAIQRIAVIGDIHGCYEELEQLYKSLSWIGLDEIWCTGDWVDRGPHSGKSIKFGREHNIKSVLGNHCESIIGHWDRFKAKGKLPMSDDKKRTLSTLTQTDVNYLKSLPPIHIIDDLGLILVHGGVWPNIPLYKQPFGVTRAQLIHPDRLGSSRWWGNSATEHPCGKTEEQSFNEGWRRWYHLYDYKEDIIFGHSTWSQPMVYKSTLGGTCIGIDTGSSFGGLLTACIYSGKEDYSFMSVKNKKVYCPSTTRQFWEAD